VEPVNEVRTHGTSDALADDAAGKNADDEDDIDKASPSGNIGEVRNPQLVWPIRLEVAIDPVQRARHRAVTERGAHPLAAPHPAQAEAARQAFDGAAHDLNPFPPQLRPDLVSAIDLKVGLPDALNVRDQKRIAANSGAALRWISLSCGMAPVGGWGDSQ